MKGQIQKWGNSLALRIPKGIAEEAHLQQRTPVEIRMSEGQIVITPLRAPRYRLEELLANIQPGQLHGETDWGVPQGREEW
ncbi:ppGpp-regulated growth inhibitor suppressor ChpR/MazE [Deinococcus phoenicis]|uniref:PpGpp-regulated growth inhibitor suppressor ChpR/MazE n=1 Tax=Deinococcus phoenicis TaxID=1476583 RepID=A0A016QRE0_9DEIO|nr:AbrB/MazE/SpoVT family DNA-binding domain-containing protein [Deinococcus phoenicis]EYB68354.1 ppGpp-regulated growth inhibitor suppressor ChpR/MazE [Deinococcus phoenicis]